MNLSSLTPKFPAPAGVLLTTTLEKNGQMLPRTLMFSQREGEQYQISVVFPEAGEYLLRIFAKNQGMESYSWALDYRILVSEGKAGYIGFPETFGAFHEHGVFLYTPRSRYLHSGSAEEFKLRVFGAESVVVIIDDQWHYLAKDGELFTANFDISKGEITVFAKFLGQDSYSGLLRYVGL